MKKPLFTAIILMAAGGTLFAQDSQQQVEFDQVPNTMPGKWQVWDLSNVNEPVLKSDWEHQWNTDASALDTMSTDAEKLELLRVNLIIREEEMSEKKRSNL